MYENYEDCKYEPSAADEVFEEAKEKLKSLLNERIKSEIEELRNRVKYLEDANKAYARKEVLIKTKEQVLQRKEMDLEKEFIKGKFSNLLEPIFGIDQVYCVAYEHLLFPKCDKCNEDRKIQFSNAYGDSTLLNCECNKRYAHYSPKKLEIKSIDVYKSNYIYGDLEFRAKFFFEPKNSDDKYCEIQIPKIIKEFDEELLKDTAYYIPYFSSEEECQKFCEYAEKRDITKKS